MRKMPLADVDYHKAALVLSRQKNSKVIFFTYNIIMSLSRHFLPRQKKRPCLSIKVLESDISYTFYSPEDKSTARYYQPTASTAGQRGTEVFIQENSPQATVLAAWYADGSPVFQLRHLTVIHCL